MNTRLCHIVHGPHDRQFHALWNQLRDEHEELVMKGYTGEGFLSQGKRLGGSSIPLDEARRRARAAAEQRKTLAKNSGKRLGGAPFFGVQTYANFAQMLPNAVSKSLMDVPREPTVATSSLRRLLEMGSGQRLKRTMLMNRLFCKPLSN